MLNDFSVCIDTVGWVTGRASSLWRNLASAIPNNYAPAPKVGGIKRWCASDVCLSVVYIGPKSRTERPRKAKIGNEAAHITRNSETTFKVNGQLAGERAGAYCGRLPNSLFWKIYQGQDLMWSNLWRNRLVKQKLSVGHQSINQSTFVKRHKSRANRRRVKPLPAQCLLQQLNREWCETVILADAGCCENSALNKRASLCACISMYFPAVTCCMFYFKHKS